MYLRTFKICLETYELDPVYCLTTPDLVWKAGFKKTKVRLDLLTDIDISLMVEKGVRGGISHVVPQNAKVNNKYIKDYDKKKRTENNHIVNIEM